MVDESQTESAPDLRSYLKILSRRRWLYLITLLTVVASTGLLNWRITPIYEGEALVEVQPTSAFSTEASRALEALVDPTRALQTQVTLARGERVITHAAEKLGLPSTQELEDSVTVDLLPDTQVLAFHAEHERPDEAASWANAVASSYLEFRGESAAQAASRERDDVSAQIDAVQRRISEIDARIERDPASASSSRAERDRMVAEMTALQGELTALPDPSRIQQSGGRIISSAELPTEPVRPKRALNLTLSVVVGSMLGLGLVLVAETLDDRLKSLEEVEERVGAPTLGYVPVVKDWTEGRSKVAILGAAASGAAEAFRTLRANLRFVSLEKPVRVLLVTSPVAEAGKSTTSANLAATLAASGSKVVLVSADLRRPTIHKFFGLSNSVGVVDLLDPSYPLAEAFQKLRAVQNLRILATGGLPPNPTEILGSERFSQILSQLKEVADYVILDAPPVLGLGDVSALASKVDGVLLVVRTGRLTKRELSHAVEQVRKAGGKIVGTVLNAVEPDEGYGYYYHYYYTQYQEHLNGRKAQGQERRGSILGGAVLRRSMDTPEGNSEGIEGDANDPKPPSES